MRTLGAALQSHLDSYATTVCFLLKIIPRAETGKAAFGSTSLDIDRAYDDGGGEITYSSTIGLNQSAVESGAGLEVDNSEAMLLIDSALTGEELAAGTLDWAKFIIYRINWKTPGQGHYIVQSGQTGIVRSSDDLAAVIDLRSLSQQLKQNYNDQYSITCRAVFGSTYDDELFPCLFDASGLWMNLTVDSVGTESDRVFSTTVAPSATGPNGALPFTTALVTFLTGANTGATVETETVSGADITLRFPTGYPIAPGDTLKIRPDCGKRYQEDCIDLYDNGDFFRGEPHIPITEEALAQYPGANVRGLGAPEITIDPTDNNDPDLQGSVPWSSPPGSLPQRMDPIEDFVNQTRVIWVPSGGLTMALTIPVTVDPMIFGFTAVANTSSNGTKRGSLSEASGELDIAWASRQAPKSTNLVTTGLGGGVNYPQFAIDNPTTARDLVAGDTYFVNLEYEDGEANWMTINAVFYDAP